MRRSKREHDNPGLSAGLDPAAMMMPRRRRNFATDRGSFVEPVLERREFLLADLDPRHDGLRIVQITDVHVGRATPARRVRAAIDQANSFAPDLVVMTGDYLSHAERGVHLAREQLAGLKAPVAAVLGNHDHWVDADGAAGALTGLGYAVLRNQNTTLEVKGAALTVVGLDDLVTRHTDIPRAFHGAPRDGSRLVLAHVPRTAEYLVHQRASLCLTGHTHGGHVNIPGITPAIMRGLREHYIAGRFHVQRTQLYVSRGIGGAVMPFRVNAPPEVTLITLRSGHPDLRRAA